MDLRALELYKHSYGEGAEITYCLGAVSSGHQGGFEVKKSVDARPKGRFQQWHPSIGQTQGQQ